MKTAIIHYWLVGMRGGENVVEALCEMYPDADIYTHVYNSAETSDIINKHRVIETFIGSLPYANKLYRFYLPLMPLALEQLNLDKYDLVISSESGPAKGVLTRQDALHICYCHTPMRYVWNMYHHYILRSSRFSRPLKRLLLGRLRQWDFVSAARVDFFIANSKNVATRISKFYQRDSKVVYPPVRTGDFIITHPEDFYLYVGQLVSYKRVDLAVDVCTHMNRNLIVIGNGEEDAALRRAAGPTVRFLGRASFDVLRDHYSRCRALLFTGEEDFGIVPLEAMASGRPVIAFRKGGALETVVEGKTGVFFGQQDRASLEDAIHRFERMENSFSPMEIADHARSFSKDRFVEDFAAAVRCYSNLSKEKSLG